MIKQVALRNRGRIEQYVVVEGKKHVFPPQQVKVFDALIADAFLDRCAPHVVKEGGIASIEDDHSFGDRVWLYNTTGNPDEIKEIEVSVYKDKQHVKEKIPNPKRIPLTVVRKMGGGQVTAMGNDGEQTASARPPREYLVPPYTRKSFPRHVADWFLNRDAIQEVPLRGAIRAARAPGDFEPNDGWLLDDLQIYGTLVSASFVAVPLEAKLRELYDMKQFTRLEDLIGGSMYERKDFEEIIEDAKGLVMKRLFFLVSNPLMRLPTRDEFEQVRSQIDGVTEKKRGRPPKAESQAVG